jgi:hypothetical protein
LIKEMKKITQLIQIGDAQNMRHIGTAILIMTIGMMGCGKSCPQPTVMKHLVSAPSTNCYAVSGQMTIRAGGGGPGLLRYSTNGNSFASVPYINRTFGDSHHWYELTVRDTLVWLEVLAGMSTNGSPVELIITQTR